MTDVAHHQSTVVKETGSDHLPRGEVTFLFSDIVASMRLFRALGTGFVTVLDEHRRLLATAWEAASGNTVGTEGDSFLVAFHSAIDAVTAACAAQHALRDSGLGVDVRMAIHRGKAVPRANGEYVSLVIWEAARVLAESGPREIIATAAAVGALPSGTRSIACSRGLCKLRDFDEPVELFQIDPFEE